MSIVTSPVIAKRNATVRFRAESELKQRIARAAAARNKKPAEFLRERAWEWVTAEEARIAAAK